MKFIIHPTNPEQGKAVRAFLETLQVPYDVESDKNEMESSLSKETNKKQLQDNVKIHLRFERNNEQVTIADQLLQNINNPLIPYRKNNHWGFCTPQKKIFVECIYDEVGRFSEGLARVCVGGKIGFINIYGELVIPLESQSIYGSFPKFGDGLTRITYNNKWGYINKQGKITIPCIYDWADEFSEGLARIKINNGYGFINNQGEIAISCRFEKVGRFSEGLAWVAKDKKCGYINKEGNLIIPYLYNDAAPFSEGLAAVKVDSYYGYINKDGEMVIPCEFVEAEPYSEGLACVFLNTSSNFGHFLIDLTGRIVQIGEYTIEKTFSEGLVAVKKDDNWGFVNRNAEVIIPFKYSGVLSPFRNDLAAINDFSSWFPSSALKGYINKEGVEFWEGDIDHPPY